MLNSEQKITYFKEYLSIKNDNFGDEIKQEIMFYYENNNDFAFLEKLNSYPQITEKIEFLVSKIILHSHEDGLHNIVQNYS